MLTYNFSNALQNGSLIGEASFPNDILRYRLQFVVDRLLYSAGGITVVYPFTFSTSPQVYALVELLDPFDPEVAYTATVTSNLIGSVTIQVNKLVYDGATLTTISEASTNEVAVSILAIGE